MITLKHILASIVVFISGILILFPQWGHDSNMVRSHAVSAMGWFIMAGFLFIGSIIARFVKPDVKEQMLCLVGGFIMLAIGYTLI